ncbi:hypothetical protein SNEBB_005303 [Seison nebaliae]|nr:hypothetical protein SNEBB_005303 [Seison nebaliae]
MTGLPIKEFINCQLIFLFIILLFVKLSLTYEDRVAIFFNTNSTYLNEIRRHKQHGHVDTNQYDSLMKPSTTFIVLNALRTILSDKTLNHKRRYTTQQPHEREGPIQYIDKIGKFLNLLKRIEDNKHNCKLGTDEMLGDEFETHYGVQRFRREAQVAVTRANVLTDFWKNRYPFKLTLMERIDLFYLMVRRMVDANENIYAAGNCYDENEFNLSIPISSKTGNEKLFCPYAYRHNSTLIVTKDLSAQYNYMEEDNDWFSNARNKAVGKLKDYYQEKIHDVQSISYYRNKSFQKKSSLEVSYDDGHWSKPYFDCGGGFIWMMTYTIPFFGYTNNRYHFKGTSGIDIDLRKVDINQCDGEDKVFRNTNKCIKKSSCQYKSGLGFRRGSYSCICEDGYYFPLIYRNSSLSDKNLVHNETIWSYNGEAVEQLYENKMNRIHSQYNYDELKCLKCADGCVTCTDNTTCLLLANKVFRNICMSTTGFISILLFFSFLLMLIKYSGERIIKSSSPLLMQIILCSSLLTYTQIVLYALNPTTITCTFIYLLRDLGFIGYYGALMLKTWRISVVFQIKSARTIKISDSMLMRRLMTMVLVVVGFLAIRTVVARSSRQQIKTADNLIAYLCKTDWWDHSAFLARFIILAWGTRLSYLVRRAPSLLNESRLIGIAIYNETICTCIIYPASLLIRTIWGPDGTLAACFIHTHVTITLSLMLIFGSKLIHLYKKKQCPLGNENSKIVINLRDNPSIKDYDDITRTNVSCSSPSKVPPISTTRCSISGNCSEHTMKIDELEKSLNNCMSKINELEYMNKQLSNYHLILLNAHKKHEENDNDQVTSTITPPKIWSRRFYSINEKIHSKVLFTPIEKLTDVNTKQQITCNTGVNTEKRLFLKYLRDKRKNKNHRKIDGRHTKCRSHLKKLREHSRQTRQRNESLESEGNGMIIT